MLPFIMKLFGFSPKPGPSAEREEPSDSGDPATQAQSSHHANQRATPTPLPMDLHPALSPPAAGLPAGTGQDIAPAAASDVHDAPHALLSPPTPHADGFVHLPDLSTRHAGTLVNDAVEPSTRERQSQAVIDSVSRGRHSLFLGALSDSFTAAIGCGCHFTIG